jgi:hypothetical protein
MLLFVREVERPLRDTPCQLRARAHSELPIDPSEMHLDGSNRGEELCRNLAVRPAGRHEGCDAPLGARQLSLSPRARAGSVQFGLRACDPQQRAELGEDLLRSVELLRGAAPLSQPAERFARREQRSPAVERKTDGLGGGDGLFGGGKRRVEIAACEQKQGTAPKARRHCPSLVGPASVESGQEHFSVVHASEGDERLDRVGHRFGEAIRREPQLQCGRWL